MFVRTINQVNGKVTVAIVENTRDASRKVCQKILRRIATVFPHEVAHLKELAEHAKSEMEEERQARLFPSKDLADMVLESRKTSESDDRPLMVNLKKLYEEKRLVTGIHEIYGSLFDEVGLSNVLHGCAVSKKVMKDVVMARLAKPCSKRSSSELLERDFGITIPLEKIYRMMDTLTADRINKLQDICWQHTKTLFTDDVKIMFYDCTTLYFESFTEDELRSFGYSKDHKFNQGQVLLALMVTQEGLPVGYDIFPGNMFEGDTFKYAIDKIKTRYKIQRAIIVADSGLLSQENIAYLEKENLGYILGARLKNLTLNWQDKILDNKDFEKKSKEDEVLRIATFTYLKNRTLIVSHSSKRAQKDRHDREKAVEKLKKKLQDSKKPQSLISNFGYKKYITIDGSANLQINTDKMERDALWDGLQGIFTNIDAETMGAEKILEQYHGLWQVEESFRISKHDLRMRPVFHWTARRIHAHIALCFAAFSLIRFLQYKIRQKNVNLSPQRISEELYRVQESILVDKINKNRYVLPSKTSEDALKIYEAMNKKRNVVPYKLNTQK